MFMPYLADESEKKYKVYFIIVELIDIEVKRNKRGVIRGLLTPLTSEAVSESR